MELHALPLAARSYAFLHQVRFSPCSSALIGLGLSEPPTSELNSAFFIYHSLIKEHPSPMFGPFPVGPRNEAIPGSLDEQVENRTTI